MNVKYDPVKIRDIFEGYADKGDEGVFAYGGRLAIRPPYQREFVYSEEQQRKVMDTVLKSFPLNAVYWVKADEGYEVLDGQQRTLSIMHFLTHSFSIQWQGTSVYCDTIPEDILEKILDYEMMVYICEGTHSEKLEWFQVVNIAGERLTKQELLNSVYTGKWLSDAKQYFSKQNCPASSLCDGYITGTPNRQELLEHALIGIAESQGLENASAYMALHAGDDDANELWRYFQDVINWARKTFPTYYKDMKGLDWCSLYNRYGCNTYNTSKLDEEVKRLHEDEEVQKPKGIYEYLLSRDTNPFAEKYLSLRTFDKRDKQKKYSEQNGKCALCGQDFKIDEMEADHIVPWSKGGKTELSNCQMLCKSCNRQKTDK